MTDIVDTETADAPESSESGGDESPSQILRTIQAVEEHLRSKRSRIEDLQTRQDDLIEEMRQLRESLESESSDFVSDLKAVIDDLGFGDADLPPQAAAEASAATNASRSRSRSKPAASKAQEKPARRSSLRWLKDKERSRRDD